MKKLFTLLVLVLSMISVQATGLITVTANSGCSVVVEPAKLADPYLSFDPTMTASARLIGAWRNETELRQKARAYQNVTFAEFVARASGLYANDDTSDVYDVVVVSPWVGYQAFQDTAGNYGYIKYVISGRDTAKTIYFLRYDCDWIAPLVTGETVWKRSWQRFNKVTGKLTPAEAEELSWPCVELQPRRDTSDFNSGPCMNPSGTGDGLRKGNPNSDDDWNIDEVLPAVAECDDVTVEIHVATPCGTLDEYHTLTPGSSLLINPTFTCSTPESQTIIKRVPVVPDRHSRIGFVGGGRSGQLQYWTVGMSYERVILFDTLGKVAANFGGEFIYSGTWSDAGIGRYADVDWGRKHSMLVPSLHAGLDWQVHGPFRVQAGAFAESYMHLFYDLADGSYWGPTATVNGGLYARLMLEWEQMYIAAEGRVGGPLNMSHARPVSEGGGFWPDLAEDGGGPGRGFDSQLFRLFVGFRIN